MVTLTRKEMFLLLFVISDWKINTENSMTKTESKLFGIFSTTG